MTDVQDLPKCRLSNDQVHKLLTTTLDQQPLTGRTVLLPVTGQAFTIGQLKPAVVMANDNNNNNKEEVEQVQLLASTTANFTTVSTKQAQLWLQPKAATIATTKPKSALKHKSTPPPPPATNSRQPPPQAAFMEIVEEYDASGKQIRSGAVNVSQQLDAIWNNAQEPAMVDQDQGWNDNDNDEVGDDQGELPNLNATLKPKPVSDDDYQRLANRLDELARLEETGAAVPSPLSKLKPKPTTTTNTKKQTASSSSSGSGWGKGFLNNNNNVKSKTTSKPKAISFGANHIQEIPRIGTTPASTITQQRQGHTPTQKPTPTMENKKQTRPFDSSVFNGVVQERPVVMEQQQQQQQQRSVIRERPMVVERQSQQQPQPTNTAPPKKRVSRFAQERSMH
jgi:hypothetical protein